MMTHETALERAVHLQREGTPYALVSVVRAQAPASARAGDKAVVTGDGLIHGWVGGGCAQPAVIRTVRQSLVDGRARLIRISPASEGHQSDLGDVLEFGMTCHSGGTLELFVDPVLPRPQLVIIGTSPVAHSLCQLAPRVGFVVTVIADGAQREDFPDAALVIGSDDSAAGAPDVAPGAWLVVATQGRRDVQGLRLALRLKARLVSFVASRRKAAVLKELLINQGEDAAAVAAILAPAGYPMPATTPEEIALSVLAATVASRRSAAPPSVDDVEAIEAPLTTVSDEAIQARHTTAPDPASAAPQAVAQGQANAALQSAALAAVEIPAAPKGAGGCCGGKR